MNAPIRYPVLDTDAEHENIRRMPALLGRASGPRNMPKSKAHLTYEGDGLAVTVRALTDLAALERYLPPRCTLAGEPIIAVDITCITNLGWLAGRGYNIVHVSVEVQFDGEEDHIRGKLNLCMWENKSDPILTGREELGMPKLFADIPDLRAIDGVYSGSAEWEGYRFFEMELDTTAGGDQDAAVQASYGGGRLPTLLHRYHQRTGEWDQADIDQIIVSHDSPAPPMEVLEKKAGVGSFAFRSPRWEDMPTQYTFVRALASLPLLEFRGGQMVRTKRRNDLKAYRIAR